MSTEAVDKTVGKTRHKAPESRQQAAQPAMLEIWADFSSCKSTACTIVTVA
jgi:hypothetical protein